MKTSDSIAKIAPALTKAFTNIGAAKKDSANPYFKSAFASLGEVMEVCKQPLLDQEIIVLQPVGHDEHGEYVETVLLHSSGEFVSDRMKLTCAKEKDPQAQGSAVSYCRRYSLQSMLFIPAVDDDAEKAMVRTPNSETRRSQVAVPDDVNDLLQASATKPKAW